ncbi:hypothetical protein MIR68_001561 [Amoeboaphelidium protococcarum]|nr:hypothetical protein MIR68_001561 [Amoeboaphelidium protococcarum]
MTTPVFKDILEDECEIKVRVYGREQHMDNSIASDQQSTASLYLEAEMLERQSLLQPLAQVYAARRQEFEEFVQGPRCTIETRVDIVDGQAPGSVKFIKNPGASKLVHTLFHPSTYRSVQSLGYGSDGLDGLASFLGVGENWKAAAAYCEADTRSDILCENSAVIGGIMCDQSYDYGSNMDIYFAQGPGNNPQTPIYFGTELKTRNSYPDGHLQSRLAQVLAAVYSLNAPILLTTPSQFKVFVENKDRDAIFTYPQYTPNNDESESTASSHSDHVSGNLIKALVILLSRLGNVKKFPNSARTKSVVSSAPRTPMKLLYTTAKDTVQKLVKKLDFGAGRQKAIDSSVVKTPRFIIGINADGSPQYQEVRVAPRDIAEKLMENVEEQDDLQFESALDSSSVDCYKLSKG